MSIEPECRAALEALGGKPRTEDGEEYWLFEVGDYSVEVEPFEWSNSDEGTTVGIEASVSHREVSSIVNAIVRARPGERQQMLWWQEKANVPPVRRTCEVLAELVGEILRRVTLIDIDAQLRELASTCPDRPSMRQILHLGALAYRGEFPALLEYVDAFGRGKRFNFVPMITKDMVDRAFDIAVERGAK